MIRRPPRSTRRSSDLWRAHRCHRRGRRRTAGAAVGPRPGRSEEHTSELQSPCNLVCRLLLATKDHTFIDQTPCTVVYSRAGFKYTECPVIPTASSSGISMFVASAVYFFKSSRPTPLPPPFPPDEYSS